jgi:single-stranded DNA-binding protein
VLYGKILDAVENSFDKGSRIMVIGELRQREYLNSQQQKVQTVEVSCSTLHVFAGKAQ